MHRILFVCLGNICRSPTGEAMLRDAAVRAGRTDIEVDSAGTGDWHLGQAPDPRAQAAALAAGIDISGHRARQVTEDDFRTFDWILACDRQNLRDLEAMRPADATAKLAMVLDFAGKEGESVPDPWYGGEEGFTETVRSCREAAQGILRALPES